MHGGRSNVKTAWFHGSLGQLHGLYTCTAPSEKTSSSQGESKPVDVDGDGGYVKVLSKQMGAIFITVYAREHIAAEISEVSAAAVSVGVLGVMGNKGAVAGKRRYIELSSLSLSVPFLLSPSISPIALASTLPLPPPPVLSCSCTPSSRVDGPTSASSRCDLHSALPHSEASRVLCSGSPECWRRRDQIRASHSRWAGVGCMGARGLGVLQVVGATVRRTCPILAARDVLWLSLFLRPTSRGFVMMVVIVISTRVVSLPL